MRPYSFRQCRVGRCTVDKHFLAWLGVPVGGLTHQVSGRATDNKHFAVTYGMVRQDQVAVRSVNGNDDEVGQVTRCHDSSAGQGEVHDGYSYS